MTIARIGKFALRHETFINRKKVNTHEIEIVKFYGEKLDVCYTIASFNEAGEIVSCGNRLLDGVTAEDIEAIKTLADIAYLIISKTEVVAAE